jgi:Putative Flp pilus-assembly TadE/G-like
MARPRRPRPSGQVLVVFCLALMALAAAAGIAIDVGRFYSEQRFLQNAADAGVLAAANALAQGMTDDQAKDQARTILGRNFIGDPNGAAPSVPVDPPVYEAGHSGDPAYLVHGILISGSDIRVAVQTSVPYSFGRIVGLDRARIVGRARVSMRADVLPIVVRHFVGAPGPNGGAAYPCTGGEAFQDLVATADTSCLGTETNATLRTAPSAGLPFDSSNPNNDPSNHGPIISLVGQGAQASNSSSFRGFVALDIRNFSSTTSNVFYNGVTAGTNANTLKGIESGWITFPGGYPGPGFPSITAPPDPNDQVALTSGNSAGQIVAAMDTRFDPGDEIVAAVYSGTVMTIPDFALPGPTQPLAIGTTQNRNGAVTMSITKNSAFTGQVTTSAHPDLNDAANPLGLGTLLPIAFSPNPITPAGTVTWTGFQTSGAAAGIYTIWIQGHSSSPYLTDHFVPVAVNVGAVARDFSSTLTPAGALVTIPTTGGTGSLNVTFSTTNSNATYFGGAVALSIEDGPANGQTPGGPAGLGSTTFSANNFNLAKNGSQAVTITLNSGSLTPGEYAVTLRATGTNLDGKAVTHLYPITLDVATSGTSSSYVDIMGFAAFRITDVNSNDVEAYAISPLFASAEDAGLRRVLVPRLAPW